MIMNYHKINQVIIPIAAAILDVLSLMKQSNKVSEVLCTNASWKTHLLLFQSEVLEKTFIFCLA
jgi:hypothetical protein